MIGFGAVVVEVVGVERDLESVEAPSSFVGDFESEVEVFGRRDIRKPISNLSHSVRRLDANSFIRVWSVSVSSLTVTSMPELSILFFVTRGSFSRICRTLS